MQVTVTHSSTACVLLEIGSVRILTDPVLDAGMKKYRLGPLANAWRYAGPTIAPESIPELDAVLLSHAHHFDNLDAAGREILKSANQIITGPKDAGELGNKAIGLKTWDKATITGRNGETIHVIATPARHGPWWFPGTHRVTGFLLEWQGQRNGMVYISGDTVFFAPIRDIPKRYTIGTALLHMGAANFWPPWPPFLRFTFNAAEAARTAKLLNAAKTILPVHYERTFWSHFKEPKERYMEEFLAAGVLHKVRWLIHGQRTTIEV